MNTLVILAHPHLETSRVNRRWKAELLKHPGICTLHELYHDYPDGQIDVPREQRLLEEHDRTILQFPFYWYSYPPLLKKWFDDVFTYGWAYGSRGDKLKGKAMGLAMSIGDKEQHYRADGPISFTVDQLTAPFQASLRHVGAIALPHFAVYGASFQMTDEQIDRSAEAYVRYLKK
ncbi:NAD(P)H-dependent oxidoreductase [Paenibacillus daejeonensis]|uniref:NAD(P)H-dependent oxidoreductase n=1 Tax=Paenibacillus daejeonensis TaxID=135193 RepID=UPI00037FFD16|nr:NAD(P)H-dependent oxidoreductase [Paenibacillus daejeonensis]